MADSNMQLNWTDEQWNKVRQVVYEEARRARVAGNLLPLYGPLEPDARYVAMEEVCGAAEGNPAEAPGITVRDSSTLKLSTLQVNVYLRGAQVADPELDSATLAFRRAASLIARLEDDIIFRGQEDADRGPPPDDQVVDPADRPPARPREIGERESVVHSGQRSRGLLAAIARLRDPGVDGNRLVGAVSSAISKLERRRHFGPFACVLDHRYFEFVQTPNPDSLVLPQDRILPFLGGGVLVRSSSLPPQTGLVIASSGAPIDLVVGTDISVSFLQTTTKPWFVFRVFEKIVLRIKQPGAIEPINDNLDQNPPEPAQVAPAKKPGGAGARAKKRPAVPNRRNQ